MATITKSTDREREALRRSASGGDQGPKMEQQAHVYPFDSELGLLGDPQDPTNATFPFLRRIRRDHMVSMGLHFISMPIIKASWYYEADDARAAAFADHLIRPIYGDLVVTILRMLWAGYSPAAKNFEATNPSWTYYDRVSGEMKRIWDTPNVDALIYKPVIQLRPENALPIWKDGKFNGIKYDGRYGNSGGFIINGERKPDIDLLHSVWAVHDQANEDGSPFGFPRIAHCAPIFHMYRYIWTLLGRAFENNADPGPVVRYPYSQEKEYTDDGKLINNAEIALRLARRRRSGSSIALPSNVYKTYDDKFSAQQMWGIEYPKSETNFTDIMSFLGFLESAKLRSLWVQEQGLIEGSGGQSNRNVASEFGDQRDASQVVLMQQIDELIDQVFIKPAMAMNMPWYEGKLKKVTMGFGSAEENTVNQIIQLVGQGNYKDLGVDIRRIMEVQNVPTLSPEEFAKQQKEAAKIAQQGVTPAVKPTEGRRALVTQTGFDRETNQPVMVYNQLGGTIDLSDQADGDFVASLPTSDIFADRKVVAAARDLRRSSVSFLMWYYTDFARYISRLDADAISLSLEVIADEHFDLEGEELAEDKKVRKVVEQLFSSWKPDVSRITSFADKARSVVGRVYDRTAGLQLARVGSKSKTSSTDKVAAQWLDDRGSEMVSSVMQTTRQQISEILSQGVRDKKTPKEIAAEIREHFTDFPASRATTIARTEVAKAYNYATVKAGLAAGVKKGQLLDGNSDKPCKARNGRIVSLEDALKEKLAHPNCTLTIRLLPRAASNLEVVRTPLDKALARYDEPTQTILLSPNISQEEESAYLLVLGDHFAQPIEDGEAANSSEAELVAV